jgi:DEAD/DEAH box helicase domain-containing protein
MAETLYVDVTCQLSAEEVGGWEPDCMHRRGIAAAVTWNNNQPPRRTYREHEFEELVDELESARVVVGYNCQNFDFEIIRGYCDVSPRRSLDMFADLRHLTGQELPINAVLKGTFGGQISADNPLDQIKWWREEQYQLVEESIARSVAHIRSIHEFGLEHGYVRYVGRFGRTEAVNVDWRV